jgi:acyl dehydratase
MLDRSLIGYRFPDRVVDVEAGQLRFFAKATGETNPIYFDVEAAKAAGHRALPAPPTFLFSLDLQSNEGNSLLDLLQVSIAKVLHGEQRFQHLGLIYAGDRLTLKCRITDIYDKKGGALEFVVQDTEAENQDGSVIATSRTVTVVRNS